VFDKDIPTEPLPPSLQNEDNVAVKFKFNEVRIGSMTRARVKLLKQQMNLLYKLQILGDSLSSSRVITSLFIPNLSLFTIVDTLVGFRAS
jgi:hypothetical protein